MRFLKQHRKNTIYLRIYSCFLDIFLRIYINHRYDQLSLPLKLSSKNKMWCYQLLIVKLCSCHLVCKVTLFPQIQLDLLF